MGGSPQLGASGRAAIRAEYLKAYLHYAVGRLSQQQVGELMGRSHHWVSEAIEWARRQVPSWTPENHLEDALVACRHNVAELRARANQWADEGDRQAATALLRLAKDYLELELTLRQLVTARSQSAGVYVQQTLVLTPDQWRARWQRIKMPLDRLRAPEVSPPVDAVATQPETPA